MFVFYQQMVDWCVTFVSFVCDIVRYFRDSVILEKDVFLRNFHRLVLEIPFTDGRGRIFHSGKSVCNRTEYTRTLVLGGWNP